MREVSIVEITRSTDNDIYERPYHRIRSNERLKEREIMSNEKVVKESLMDQRDLREQLYMHVYIYI